MIKTVQPERKRRREGCPEEAAFLDLLRTTDLLSRGLAQVLKNEELSATQYNVLRILRGSPDGLPCGDIASRMITRDPDITRLVRIGGDGPRSLAQPSPQRTQRRRAESCCRPCDA